VRLSQVRRFRVVGIHKSFRLACHSKQNLPQLLLALYAVFERI
jgi:hypothetical protein